MMIRLFLLIFLKRKIKYNHYHLKQNLFIILLQNKYVDNNFVKVFFLNSNQLVLLDLWVDSNQNLYK